MRNWILFILVIFLGLFFTCTPEPQKTIEKEIVRIATEKLGFFNLIYTITDNSGQTGYGLVNAVVYPIAPATAFNFNLRMPSFSTNVYAGDGNGYVNVDATTKNSNYISGIFYHDNGFYSTDLLYGGVWRTLDLSAQVGSQESKVTLYVKVVGIDPSKTELNETAKFQFRSPDGILAPVTAQAKYGDIVFYAVQVTTDTNGYVQWAYTGSNVYDAKFDTGDPEYHDYRWMQCEIWLYEYWKSEVVTTYLINNDKNPLKIKINNLILRSSIVCGFVWKKKNEINLEV